MHDQMCHDNLELCGREEASWAGKLAVSEMQVVFVRVSELMLVLFARLLAHLVIAESVEFLGIRHVGRVFGDGVGSGANLSPSREVEAVR